jgi:hypothetical protein
MPMRRQATLLGSIAAIALTAGPSSAQPASPFDREFYFRMLGNRCLDFGGEAFWALGGPVIIYQCNGTVAQRVRVREIGDGTYDVELRVRDLYCIGATPAQGRRPEEDRDRGRVRPTVSGAALELQRCNKSAQQRFALDGDTILMGRQVTGAVTREFAIEPKGRNTNLRTPLVVAPRDASDAQYFRFHAVDASGAQPHSGFVTVSTEFQLATAIFRGTPGTVIEIDPTVPIQLKATTSRYVRRGLTIRGYRKLTFQGPEVYRCNNSEKPAFLLAEPDVRITGFRFSGHGSPRCGSSGDLPSVGDAVFIASYSGTLPRTLIDHMEFGWWGDTAINISGPGPERDPIADNDFREDCIPVSMPRDPIVRAIGNFFHHLGIYGVSTGDGAFSLARGNVAYHVHNHVITTDGAKTSGYVAHGNLFLRPSGSQELDIHGTQPEHSWDHGLAGHYFDIGWNTATGTEKYYQSPTFRDPRPNFYLRGTPCLRVDLHHNVFRQSESAAIHENSEDDSRLVRTANIFGVDKPLNDLAVGDFDGDGIDDMFVGTGAAWYFSSGGRAEWRLLNIMPDKASTLRFGDFDDDGRTDVVAVHGLIIDISWAGQSPWYPINSTATGVSELAVGDFDGDRNADLFRTTGDSWEVAHGGRNWTFYAPGRQRTRDLRFGDLTGDGKTDVVSTNTGRWKMMTRHNGTDEWVDLTVNLQGDWWGVVVANFVGNRRADLAVSRFGDWWVSDAGMRFEGCSAGASSAARTHSSSCRLSS